MAVDVTLLNNNSTTNITTNFQRVITALEDAVSRSGTAPNNMSADLDMDGNDIINIGSLSLQGGNTLEGFVADAEAAQVAAEAAQALSEAAVSDAETAATNAESAVTDAESAETAALAAQSAAEASATAAAASVASIASNTIDVNGTININLASHGYDLFRFHTSTGTANLDAAATLGDAFTCFIKADGVAVTIDPDGSETINGASTLVLADGQSAKLYCNGTTWNAVLIGAGSGGGGIVYEEKTSAYTAEAGDGIGANTTSGAFSVTLPASPSVGDVVIVADTHGQWATNNLTIARNGENIQRVAEDLVCDISNIQIELVYFSNGWIAYPSGNVVGTVPLYGSNNLNDVGDAAASRGNLNTWVDKTAAYTMVAGDWVYADTSGGAFTLTLPASPSEGDEVKVADPSSTWAINSVTIARNGNTISGNVDDMECSTGGVTHIFTYDSSAGNWRVQTLSVSGGDYGKGLIKLETIVANNDVSLDFITGLDSDEYTGYLMEFESLLSATDGADLAVRYSTDGGGTWETGSSYYNERFYVYGTNVAYNATTSTSSRVSVGIGNVDSGETGASGFFRVYNLGSASIRTTLLGDCRHRAQSNLVYRIFSNNEYTSEEAHNGIQLIMSTGNVLSGTATLYGIKK